VTLGSHDAVPHRQGYDVADAVRCPTFGSAHRRRHRVGGERHHATGSDGESAGQDPKQSPTSPATLDVGMRRGLAKDARPQSHARRFVVVVIKPSTGDVVAVGQKPRRDAEGPIRDDGPVPAGSTFKDRHLSAALTGRPGHS